MPTVLLFETQYYKFPLISHYTYTYNDMLLSYQTANETIGAVVLYLSSKNGLYMMTHVVDFTQYHVFICGALGAGMA